MTQYKQPPTYRMPQNPVSLANNMAQSMSQNQQPQSQAIATIAPTGGNINFVMQQGFSQGEAYDALSRSNNDVAFAIDLLVKLHYNNLRKSIKLLGKPK